MWRSEECRIIEANEGTDVRAREETQRRRNAPADGIPNAPGVWRQRRAGRCDCESGNKGATRLARKAERRRIDCERKEEEGRSRSSGAKSQSRSRAKS